MQTVKEILDAKGHDFWQVGPDATVYEAVQLMTEKGVGSVLVMEQAELRGIFTERDYVHQAVQQGESALQQPVRALMTPAVLYAKPEQTLEECMALMTERRVRHLPVLIDHQVQGVISIGDLVKSVIAEQQFIIEQLENYIAS
jgi:CBS domain-containing protein